jgi:hypothetical protein
MRVINKGDYKSKLLSYGGKELAREKPSNRS